LLDVCHFVILGFYLYLGLGSQDFVFVIWEKC